MNCGSRLRAALGAALLFGAILTSADARPPEPESTPTLEDIAKDVKTAIAEKQRQEAEASRDPYQEAIDGYREKKLELTNYARLVEVILNSADEDLQRYRRPAAEALITRFQNEILEDPVVRSVRRDIGLALIELMKKSKDRTGLELIEQLLKEWWQPKFHEFGFRASEKYRKRMSAYQRMKRYLEKEEK